MIHLELLADNEGRLRFLSSDRHLVTLVSDITARYSRKLASVGFVAALILTLCGLFLNNVTLVTDDYTFILALAIAAAIVAMILTITSWTRFATLHRVVSAVLFVANTWTLLDAGGRRLLGW